MKLRIVRQVGVQRRGRAEMHAWGKGVLGVRFPGLLHTS